MYLDLVYFMLFLCMSMPVWVFFYLIWQMWCFKGIMCSSMESKELELIWTIGPSFMVLLLCFLKVQYISFSNPHDISGCVKVVGHQWYWSYEIPGQSEYDSLMTDLLSGVDKPLRLFYQNPYILLVTSADVIHSFSMPDLGVKIDAIPGRINQGDIYLDRMGVFTGYCTELCGAGHSYMPVVLEVLKRVDNF